MLPGENEGLNAGSYRPHVGVSIEYRGGKNSHIIPFLSEGIRIFWLHR